MAHRICTVMMGGVLAWAASASAQTNGTSTTKRAGMASASNRVATLRSAVAPVRTLLRKPVARVEWVEKTFEEVLEWLRAQSDDKVNVVPRWNALNAEGVDQESSVSLKLVGTSVAEILNEVMGQLSEDRAVMYRGSRNMLRISSRDDFGRDLPVRVYDITDILFDIPDMGRSAPAIDLDRAAQSGGSGGGGGGQSVFTGGTSSSEDLEEEESEVEERLEEIRDMILAVIEPNSWTAAGGLGDIQIFNDRALIIRNTVEVHEKLAGFFVKE